MRRRSFLQQLDIDADMQTQNSDYESDAMQSDSTYFATENHVGHRWSSPGTVSDRIDLKQLECDVGGAYAPWGGARDGDDGEQNVSASISVNMSILNELCQYRDDDQREAAPNFLWRYYPSEEQANVPAFQLAADESGGADPEKEHEERRVLERFASFPSGRPTTPKNRRRVKRKGTESPRNSVNCATAIAPSHSQGQGHTTKQLHCDLNEDQSAACFGNEPVTSHGMRPARGWVALEIGLEEDDEVIVSPRVQSPEMDEAAGAVHSADGFASGEAQEKRTTFLALGSLRHVGRSQVHEHPATQRAKHLVQLIGSLKEKVKLYEDAFEQRYGYRPSHHQKMDDRNTKRILTELARVRKELKQLKERYHLSDIEAVDSSESPTTLKYQPPTASNCNNPAPNSCVDRTVDEIQQHLAENRQLAGRPEAVDQLSWQQVLDEKLAVQRALLYVESIHGRPASLRHKDLLRPLYDRYRSLKRMVVRSGLSRSKEDVSELAPILEHEALEIQSQSRAGAGWQRHSAPPTPSLESADVTARFSMARRNLSHSASGAELVSGRSTAGQSSHEAEDKDLVLWKRQKITLNIEENLHALPVNQLIEQMRNVREEKRRLRRKIRELEANMLRQGATAASPSIVDGDSHLEPVHVQYRHARAKLRLLEALVAKHDGSATL